MVTERAWAAGGILLRAERWRADAVELRADTGRHSIYVTLGGGSVRTEIEEEGGHRYAGRDRPGNVSVVPSGRRRRAFYCRVDMRYASLRVAPETLGRLVPPAAARAMLEREPLSNGEDSVVCHAVQAVLAAVAEHGMPDDLLAEGAVAMLGAHLGRSGPPHGPRRTAGAMTARRLARIEGFVAANLHRNLSLAELASVLDLSPAHLGRIFRLATGRTLHQHLTHRRIEKAQELLATTDLPPGEIALRTGFADQPHFSKAFRRVVGAPPAAWRASLET